MKWFKSLSTLWKAIIVIAVLAIGLWIFDATTGYVRQVKNVIFDHKIEKLEADSAAKEAENVKLRAENAELIKGALAAKAKEAVFDEREKNLDAKTKAELEKLDKALEEQNKAEAETAEVVDDYTRCTRMKDKLLGLGLQSAKRIDCEVYPHE